MASFWDSPWPVFRKYIWPTSSESTIDVPSLRGKIFVWKQREKKRIDHFSRSNTIKWQDKFNLENKEHKRHQLYYHTFTKIFHKRNHKYILSIGGNKRIWEATPFRNPKMMFGLQTQMAYTLRHQVISGYINRVPCLSKPLLYGVDTIYWIIHCIMCLITKNRLPTNDSWFPLIVKLILLSVLCNVEDEYVSHLCFNSKWSR